MSVIYIAKEDREPTAYLEDEVRSALERGELKQDHLYWHEGMTCWAPLHVRFQDRREETQSAGSLLHLTPPLPPVAEARDYRVGQQLGRWASKVQICLNGWLFFTVLAFVTQILLMVLVYQDAMSVEFSLWYEKYVPAVLRVFSTAFLVVLLICLSSWTTVANENARRFGTRNMAYTASSIQFIKIWLFGALVLPILVIFGPYRCWRELSRVSQNPTRWKEQTPDPLLVCGLVLWCVLAAVKKAPKHYPLIQDVWWSTHLWGLLACAILIPCLLIMKSIVKNITDAQESLHERFHRPSFPPFP